MNRLLLFGLVVALPLRNIVVTSGFGFRIHPVTHKYAFHDGVDLRAVHDTVFSVTSGMITRVSYNAVSGTYIKIAAANLIISYCHLSQIFLLPGDSVLSGQPIAITGNSGRTTGEHLHLTVRCNGAYIDPLAFLLNAAKYFNQNKKENNK